MNTASGASHTLQLRITDTKTGRLKVALTLPIGLIGTAQRLGASILPPDTTIDSLLRQAELSDGATHSWTNTEHAERLELIVE